MGGLFWTAGDSLGRGSRNRARHRDRPETGPGRLYASNDRKTGFPSGYRLAGKDVPSDILSDFGYGRVDVYSEAPAHPIRVAAPKPVGEIVASFAAWLRQAPGLRLEVMVVRKDGTTDPPEVVEFRRPLAVRQTRWAFREAAPRPWVFTKRSPIPGFEPFFGARYPKGQAVGIRWFDESHEAYVVRFPSPCGHTDVYFATVPVEGRHEPAGYERYVGKERVERAAIQVRGPSGR